jgi:glutathione synthase/RimK-type ligase-like ATP-grasp enzyme
LNPDEADWHPFSLTQEATSACLALTEALGLRYAAIDLVDDGEHLWFLEVNQGGEFQFIDRPLGLGITQDLARALAICKRSSKTAAPVIVL